MGNFFIFQLTLVFFPFTLLFGEQKVKQKAQPLEK